MEVMLGRWQPSEACEVGVAGRTSRWNRELEQRRPGKQGLRSDGRSVSGCLDETV